MTLESYGLIPENPVRLNSEKAALGYLESLVTKNESYHIFFHKLMSFDFNVFDGKEKTAENTTNIYQICTNDETKFILFINTHCEECVWIPPAPFEFEYDTICICEEEMTEDSEAVYSTIQVDKKYVSEIRANWVVDDFDKFYPESMKHILFRNWGVNYKTDNFPYELWEMYIKENTICLSDLSVEELEERNKMLVGLLINDFNLQERLN